MDEKSLEVEGLGHSDRGLVAVSRPLEIRLVAESLSLTEKRVVECLKETVSVSKAWRLFKERYKRSPVLPTFKRWASRDRIRSEMVKYYEEKGIIGKWSEGKWVSELDGIAEGRKEGSVVQLGALKMLGDYKGYLKKAEKEMPENVRIEILQANGEK